MKDRFNMPISFGSHCSNHDVLIMALCYEPSDILFYVKFSDIAKFPDDKHAVCLDKVDKLCRNLKTLVHAMGSGAKEKVDNKITEMKI